MFIKSEMIWEVNLFLIATFLTLGFHEVLTFLLLACAFCSLINNMSVIMSLKRSFLNEKL